MRCVWQHDSRSHLRRKRRVQGVCLTPRRVSWLQCRHRLHRSRPSHLCAVQRVCRASQRCVGPTPTPARPRLSVCGLPSCAGAAAVRRVGSWSRRFTWAATRCVVVRSRVCMDATSWHNADRMCASPACVPTEPQRAPTGWFRRRLRPWRAVQHIRPTRCEWPCSWGRGRGRGRRRGWRWSGDCRWHRRPRSHHARPHDQHRFFERNLPARSWRHGRRGKLGLRASGLQLPAHGVSSTRPCVAHRCDDTRRAAMCDLEYECHGDTAAW